MASIMPLFKHRSPSTIFRAIGAVVINTLNCHSLGSDTHVSNKIFKVMPRGADINTASPIIFKVLIIGIITAVQHCRPYAIFGGTGLSMLRISLNQLFSKKTTTALCLSL